MSGDLFNWVTASSYFGKGSTEVVMPSTCRQSSCVSGQTGGLCGDFIGKLETNLGLIFVKHSHGWAK